MKKVLLFGGICFLVLSAVLLKRSLNQFIMPPIYESAARIDVGIDRVVDIQSAVPDPPATQHIQAEIDRLQSSMVLYQVITNLDLNQKWGTKLKEGTFGVEATYAILKSQLRIGLAPKSAKIIEIRARSDDPVEAAAIANQIAKVRLEQIAAMERYMTEKAIEALESHARETTVEIQGLEAKLNQMSKELDLPIDASQPALLNKGDSGVAMLKLRRDIQALLVSQEKLVSRLHEEKVQALIPGHRPFRLIDSAEPEPGTVYPRPIMKAFIPFMGLLTGVAGIIFLLLRFKISYPTKKSPASLTE